jgi:hypothetical protein
MQARQVNDGLLSSVQEQLDTMRNEADDHVEELRHEVGEQSETLRAKLELKLADTVS